MSSREGRRVGITTSRRGGVGELPGGLGLGCHVGEHELDALELGMLLPNCWRSPRVGDRCVHRSLRDPDGLCRDTQPGAVEGLHCELEPFALVADAIRGRNPDVVEGQLRGRRARMPILCSTRGAAKPGLSVSTMNALIPFRPPAAGSVRAKTVSDVRDRAVGDESLRPVEDVLVTVARGPHPVRGHIRARGRLGQGKGDQPLAAGRIAGSIGPSARRSRPGGSAARRASGRSDQAGRRVGSRDLLDEDGLRDRVKVRPTVRSSKHVPSRSCWARRSLRSWGNSAPSRVDLSRPWRDALVRQLAHTARSSSCSAVGR